MPTVFVTQEPWPDRETGEPIRDFTPAERYGKLKILLPSDHPPSGRLAREMLDAGLDQYSPEDYIVLSGHPATIGVAVALAAQRCPVVRLLMWSGRKRAYDLVVVDLGAVAEIGQ